MLRSIGLSRGLSATFGAAALGAVVATAPTPVQAELSAVGDPKPAVILFGDRNDGGWSQAHDEARVRLEEALGITIPIVENIAENATQIRPAAELFIERGHNIIIGTAFGYSDAFKELAAENPDVLFLNAAGITNADNLKSFYGRTYETHYLCGMAAAAASETGKLGFVAANPFGLVNWTVNAYLLGARRINPEATVTTVFTGAWADPVKERAAAEALAEQGVDVIGQHVDTPTVQVVASEAGIFGTGHHRDLSEFSAATQCSSVWVWDRFLKDEIEAVAAGGFEPAPFGMFLSIADGGPDIVCCGDAVSEDETAMIMAARDEIVAGKHVFEGPIMDTTGTERVAAGAVLGDADLWGMDWYVDGVITQ